MEAADVRRFTDNVPFHRRHELVARWRWSCRQIQLGVQGVELKHVVMERANAGTGSEVGAHRAATNARTCPCAVSQVSAHHSFRQTLCGSGNIEHAPVKRVGCSAGRRIFDVMENNSEGLHRRGLVGSVITASSEPMEIELVFINSGNTPAYDVVCYAEGGIQEHPFSFSRSEFVANFLNSVRATGDLNPIPSRGTIGPSDISSGVLEWKEPLSVIHQAIEEITPLHVWGVALRPIAEVRDVNSLDLGRGGPRALVVQLAHRQGRADRYPAVCVDGLGCR